MRPLNSGLTWVRTARAQVWNMSSGEQHELGGCAGQVLALTATHGMLIAGGQDRAIRVWKLNAASQRCEPQARAPALRSPPGREHATVHGVCIGLRANEHLVVTALR